IVTSALIPVLCAPIDTALEPAYEPEPKKRGTVGLFWSCAVTYGLCIWTAIHTDIVPHASRSDRLCYKMLWVTSAIMLPEFVFIIALNQFRQARELRKLWCTKFPDTMGLQGGFFVLMGGFTIRRNLTMADMDNTPRTITMTPAGFERLISLRHWDDLTNSQNRTEAKLSRNPFEKEEIDDKGKADSISKAIVSFQALWMLLQCAGRKLDGLPITLTEIHVAICI
ncbi:hypothetical protein K440DRAFT_471760, partial [Wilcoxina mikolae CBS 423.85]